MAYTKSVLSTSVWGNKRVVVLQVTADAASGAVESGLGVIESIGGLAPVSMATAAIKLKQNLNSGTTALNGSVMVSSAVSGDVFNIVCIGR